MSPSTAPEFGRRYVLAKLPIRAKGLARIGPCHFPGPWGRMAPYRTVCELTLVHRTGTERA